MNSTSQVQVVSERILQYLGSTRDGCHPHNLTPQLAKANQIVKVISYSLGIASAD